MYPLFFVCEIDLSWNAVIQCLVKATFKVKPQILGSSCSCITRTRLRFHRDLLICTGSPEAFRKNSIEGAATAHHADAHLMGFEQLRVLWTGELAAPLRCDQSGAWLVSRLAAWPPSRTRSASPDPAPGLPIERAYQSRMATRYIQPACRRM